MTPETLVAAIKYRMVALLMIPLMALSVSPLSVAQVASVHGSELVATASGAAEPTIPSCPLTERSGRTIVHFGNDRLLSGGQKETVHRATVLSPGTYSVTLVAWDGYNGRESVTQAHEQWHAVVADGSGVIAESSPSGDVPDLVREGTWQGVTDSELSVVRSSTHVYGVHSFYTDTSSPNSVVPICAAFDKKEVPQPACDVFTASPTTFVGSGTTTLAWQTTNATDVEIDNGIGTVSVDGSMSVPVDTSKTFTLTASNGTDSVTCTAPIVVNSELHPVCDSFTATPSRVSAGGGSVVLAWQTTNATGVSINNGVGAVPVDGSRTVTVASDTTYTLTASDDNESVTCSVPVLVDPPEAGARCESFTASPTSFDSVPTEITLTWKTADASEVSINGLGTVALNGSDTITVRGSDTFTLTAVGAGGSDTCQVNVTYNPPSGGGGGGGSSSPYCRFTISDKKIVAGEEVVLSWDNDRTNDIVIEDNRGNILVDSDQDSSIDEDEDSITVSPERDTRYTLTAIRGSRERTCTVDVEVEKKVVVNVTREQTPLTIDLVTVPYTGFDLVTALTISFYTLLGLWAFGTLYILVTNRNPALRLSALRRLIQR